MSYLIKSAWQRLEDAIISYEGRPVGTLAACDSQEFALNYDQCFVRDFAVSAIAFLMRGQTDIVRNFLTTVLSLQSCQKQMDCFSPGQGLMPASFKITCQNEVEEMQADFGEHAIARVAPIDSGFWWLLVLRAYVKASGDLDLAHQHEFQKGIERILDLCLTARFEMLPTLLVPDGSFAIDRRMGVYGHPLDVQALFYLALRSAKELLAPENDYIEIVNKRLGHLTYHLRTYYWLDFAHLNEVYHYQVEQVGKDANNKFNIYPDSIPEWLPTWMPDTGGYFVGNLGPARIDFRWFAQGNLMAILGSLASDEQSQGIMSLIKQRSSDLLGQMPLKMCFPALEGRDWEVLTGCDAKNSPWSYHNGGNWPFLLWQLAAAAVKTGNEGLAQRALDIAIRQLPQQDWPEYYDGRDGRFVGKKARKFQTWTIAGFLVAQELLQNPQNLECISFSEDAGVEVCPD